MATNTANRVATNTADRSRRTGSMSDTHKAALAEGREQGQVVRRYLEAIEAQPSRKSRRTPEMVQRRLAAIEADLASAPAVIRLQLMQERLDLLDELERSGSSEQLQKLEDDFVECAGAYGERKGISYAAWREIGVSAQVLKRAGISPRSSADRG
jgi:hypothetical protein